MIIIIIIIIIIHFIFNTLIKVFSLSGNAAIQKLSEILAILQSRNFRNNDSKALRK